MPLYMSVGFSLYGSGVDVRYDEAHDGGDEYEVDFTDWSTTPAKAAPQSSAINQRELIQAATEAAEMLGGYAVGNQGDAGYELSLRFDERATPAEIRDQLIVFLAPLGVDVDRSIIGAGNLLNRIEDKGGEVKEIRVDLLLVDDGLHLNSRRQVTEDKAGGEEREAPREKPETLKEAELGRIRGFDLDKKLSEVAARIEGRIAAARVEAAEAEAAAEKARADAAEAEAAQLRAKIYELETGKKPKKGARIVVDLPVLEEAPAPPRKKAKAKPITEEPTEAPTKAKKGKKGKPEPKASKFAAAPETTKQKAAKIKKLAAQEAELHHQAEERRAVEARREEEAHARELREAKNERARQRRAEKAEERAAELRAEWEREQAAERRREAKNERALERRAEVKAEAERAAAKASKKGKKAKR